MAHALRAGGVYQDGTDTFVDASGKPTDPPTTAEIQAREDARTRGPAPVRAPDISPQDDEPEATDTATPAGDLSDEYPGVAELRAAGVTTHEQVRATSDEDLRAIDGIAPKTLKAIRALDPAAE